MIIYPLNSVISQKKSQKFKKKMEKINELIHKIPSTQMCCCCVDLRTAGLIIGGLRILGDISLFLGLHPLIGICK